MTRRTNPSTRSKPLEVATGDADYLGREFLRRPGRPHLMLMPAHYLEGALVGGARHGAVLARNPDQLLRVSSEGELLGASAEALEDVLAGEGDVLGNPALLNPAEELSAELGPVRAQEQHLVPDGHALGVGAPKGGLLLHLDVAGLQDAAFSATRMFSSTSVDTSRAFSPAIHWMRPRRFRRHAMPSSASGPWVMSR